MTVTLRRLPPYQVPDSFEVMSRMRSVVVRGTAGGMRPIWYAAAGTLAAAALQVVVGVLLYRHRADFALAQARLHPALSAATVRDRADGIVVGGLGTHLVLGVAYLALTRAVLLGRARARVRLTALLVLSTVAGAIAAARLGADVPVIQAGIRSVQVLSTVLRVAVVYLLWMPESSRRFFDDGTR